MVSVDYVRRELVRVTAHAQSEQIYAINIVQSVSLHGLIVVPRNEPVY